MLYLKQIHDRGAVVVASQARAYLSAAFAFGLRSAYDYTADEGATTDFGITSNPISAIRTDASAHRARDRFLSPAEFRKFWGWLVAMDDRSYISRATRVLMATGQRVEEILRISTEVFDRSKSMLYWPSTKNGQPHSIPIAPAAFSILGQCTANTHGLLFPNRNDATRPAGASAVLSLVAAFCEETGTPRFASRDLRRTWKTLAGDAGISKEMRDQLQNHTKSDISSRHYDRFDGLPDKRAAIAKWAAYMDLVLAGKISEIGDRAPIVVPIAKDVAA
jgi:integrase